MHRLLTEKGGKNDRVCPLVWELPNKDLCTTALWEEIKLGRLPVHL